MKEALAKSKSIASKLMQEFPNQSQNLDLECAEAEGNVRFIWREVML